MKNRYVKTVLSWMLCLSMVFTSVPTRAFAEGPSGGSTASDAQTTETADDSATTPDKGEDMAEAHTTEADTTDAEAGATTNSEKDATAEEEGEKDIQAIAAPVAASQAPHALRGSVSPSPLTYFGVSLNGVTSNTVAGAKAEIDAEFPDHKIKLPNQAKDGTTMVLGYNMTKNYHAGDSFVDTLPDSFIYTGDLDIDVNIGGVKVGTAHLDAATGKLTTTFSADVTPGEYVLRIKTPLKADAATDLGYKDISVGSVGDTFTLYRVNAGDTALEQTSTFSRAMDKVTTTALVNKDYSFTGSTLDVTITNDKNILGTPTVTVYSYDKQAGSALTNETPVTDFTYSNGKVTVNNADPKKQYKVVADWPINDKTTQDLVQTVTANGATTSKTVAINYDTDRYQANPEQLTLKKIGGSGFAGWELEIDGHAKKETAPIDTVTFNVKVTDSASGTVIPGDSIRWNDVGQVTYKTVTDKDYNYEKNAVTDPIGSITDIFDVTTTPNADGTMKVTLKLKDPANAHNAYKIKFNTAQTGIGRTTTVTITGDNSNVTTTGTNTVNTVSDTVRLVAQGSKKTLVNTIYENGVPAYNEYEITFRPNQNYAASELSIADLLGTNLAAGSTIEVEEVSGTMYKITPDTANSDPFGLPTINSSKPITMADLTINGNTVSITDTSYKLLNTAGYDSNFKLKVKVKIDPTVAAAGHEFKTENNAHFEYYAWPQNLNGGSGVVPKVTEDKASDGEQTFPSDDTFKIKKYSVTADNDTAAGTNVSQMLHAVVANASTDATGNTITSITLQDHIAKVENPISGTLDDKMIPGSFKYLVLDDESSVIQTIHGVKSWKPLGFNDLKNLYTSANAKPATVTMESDGQGFTYKLDVAPADRGKPVMFFYLTETNDKWGNTTTVENKATIAFNDDNDVSHLLETKASARYNLNHKMVTKSVTTPANDTSKNQSWQAIIDPGEYFSENKKLINPVIKDTLSQPTTDGSIVNSFDTDSLTIKNTGTGVTYVKDTDYDVVWEKANSSFTVTFKNGENITSKLEITVNSKSATSNTVTNSIVLDNFTGLRNSNAADGDISEDTKQVTLPNRSAQASKTVSFTEGNTDGKKYLAKLWIKKTDQLGNPLEGVKFTATNVADSQYKYELTTDATGTAVANDVVVGTYKIEEDANSIDTSKYQVETSIPDLEVKKFADAAHPTDAEKAANTRTVVNKQKTGTDITLKKKFTNGTLEAGLFTFTLTDSDGNVLGTAKNDANGNVTFSSATIEKLNYTAAGTYTYKVKEADESVAHAGITYDTAEQTVTVKVENQGGTLVAKQEGAPVFTNVMKPVTYQVKALKVLDGKAFQNADGTSNAFEFELVDEHGTVVATGTNDAAGTVTFSGLTYDKAGTYNYKVREKKGTIEGIAYDASEKSVSVEVKDVNHQLVASQTSTPTFTNVYKNITFSPAVKKTLEGMDIADANGKFKFEIFDQDGQKVGEATNDASGNIVFPEITYDKTGDYTYTVKEVADNAIPGVAYDSSVKTVTIRVSVDSDNQFKAEQVEAADTVAFKNVFKDISFAPTVKKTLEGMDVAETAGKFKFEIFDQDGQKVGEATNDADGNVVFPEITYKNVGDYTYTVKEVADNSIPGITYDSSTKTVTVRISVDSDNQFKAEQVEAADTVAFKNVFKPASTSLNVKKRLEGGLELKAGDYHFALRDADGNEVATGTNDADGNVTFTSSSLIFSKPGRYTFKARELSDNPIANVTYDSSEKEIVVNVTTDENNQLVATQESTPEFVNTYVAPKKPGKLLPWTGDTTSFVAIGVLAGASLAAFAAATAIRRKRSE